MTINALNHLDAFENFSHCWNNPKRKGGKKATATHSKGYAANCKSPKPILKKPFQSRR